MTLDGPASSNPPDGQLRNPTLLLLKPTPDSNSLRRVNVQYPFDARKSESSTETLMDWVFPKACEKCGRALASHVVRVGIQKAKLRSCSKGTCAWANDTFSKCNKWRSSHPRFKWPADNGGAVTGAPCTTRLHRTGSGVARPVSVAQPRTRNISAQARNLSPPIRPGDVRWKEFRGPARQHRP